MATFPYMPMVAIMASLVSSLVMQMSAFSYAGYMVQYLGVVDDKNKAGETRLPHTGYCKRCANSQLCLGRTRLACFSRAKGSKAFFAWFFYTYNSSTSESVQSAVLVQPAVLPPHHCVKQHFAHPPIASISQSWLTAY